MTVREFTDRFVASVVGGPVRAVVAGTSVLGTIGYIVGWWAVGAIAVTGIGYSVAYLRSPAGRMGL